MIQLNDIKGIAINPAHIIYFWMYYKPKRRDPRDVEMAQNKQGEDVIIVGELECMFSYYGYKCFQYHCAETLQQDYQKLLSANNA